MIIKHVIYFKHTDILQFLRVDVYMFPLMQKNHHYIFKLTDTICIFT